MGVSRNGRVFVVQEIPGRDVLAAGDFGELELLLPAGPQIMLNPVPVIRELWRKLRDYNSDDHILACGDPAAIGAACAIAALSNNEYFNLVKWDRMSRGNRSEGRYYSLPMDLRKGRM